MESPSNVAIVNLPILGSVPTKWKSPSPIKQLENSKTKGTKNPLRPTVDAIKIVSTIKKIFKFRLLRTEIIKNDPTKNVVMYMIRLARLDVGTHEEWKISGFFINPKIVNVDEAIKSRRGKIVGIYEPID